MINTLYELAVKHDYYASDSNYYSNDPYSEYKTWSDFYEEFKDADIDMNLVFRWDLHKREEGAPYYMQIIIIAQRKGIYIPIIIDSVYDNDVLSIKKFMEPHFKKILNIWSPLSKEFINIK